MNSQSIITYRNNDLEFGDIFIGYSETILHTDEGAAKFYFYHTKFFRSDLLVTFKLPSFLSNGNNSVPLKFSSNSGAWSYYDRQTGRVNFNPNSPLEIRRAFFIFRFIYGLAEVFQQILVLVREIILVL